MPDASVSLALEADSFDRDLARSERNFVNSQNKMGNSANRNAGAHENLLRSNHRVARQIENFTKNVLSGASAGDVFANSLDGIGRSLNLSLGQLATLGVGAVLIEKVVAVREEYHKLQEELKEVHKQASVSGDFRTLNELEQGAKRAEAAIKSLQDRIENRSSSGTGFGMWQRLKDMLANAPIWLGDIPKGLRQGGEDADSLVGAQSDLDRFNNSGVDKRRRRSDNKRDSLDGQADYLTKARELQMAHDEANPAVHEMTQAAIELNNAFRELAKTVTQQRHERAGMTLGELAGTPAIATSGMSYEQWKAGEDARLAQSLDAQGEEARANFKPDLAQNFWNASADVKSGIPDLKPSEQTASALKGALSVTETELAKIVANTAERLVNK